MADSQPAVQLMNQLFSQKQRTEYVALGEYLEKGGSIFPLVENGVKGLVKDFGVSPDDARQFLRRANSMALYVRRQFIEHGLHDTGTQAQSSPRSGLLSMVDGPTFNTLFNPGFDRMCPPQALESITSPVAYLIELLRWIETRIETVGEEDEKRPLHDRRTDLKPLSIDFNAVHRSISAVDIIVPVLEAFIEAHEPEEPERHLEDAMTEARYPNGLPYYEHWVTLDTVARHHGLSVGDFAHRVNPSFPYFLGGDAWNDAAGRALAHASRLGPFQRQLLMEDAPDFDDRDVYYTNNFGTDNTYKPINLRQVDFFGERTKLDTQGLEALLSVRRFAPVRSANVKTYLEAEAPDAPESGRSGSVYLNANAHPAVHITSGGASFSHRLTLNDEEPNGLIGFDRMNRKVRLDQWLMLPSEQVDALLVAAIRADVRGSATDGTWWISEGVVHALGLFQSLRERYSCTAADFAVFIDELSIYGRGEKLSQFDQIFNNQGDYRDPLILDRGAFPLMPDPGVPDLTVAKLCSALNIDLKTYAYLAQAIAEAHNITDGLLLRTPEIVSSFYRLVRLPRLLGITPVEGILMLTVLGGKPWLNGLAGFPQLNSTPGDTATVEPPDVLYLICAMQACTQWCADRNFTVLWMLQQLSPPDARAATDAERQFFDQVLNLLPGVLFTDSALLAAGVPALAGASWLDLLTALVDSDGLVIAYPGTEEQYLAYARTTLDDAVKDGLGEGFDSERPAIVEKMLAVLLQVRGAQASVVRETLAVYAGVDSAQAIHVLAWADATVHRLLHQILVRAPSDNQQPSKRRDEESDPLLLLLADVRRRGAVVAKLALSAELLQDYLDYGHEAWLGQDNKHAFTIGTLYYLTVLTHAFELSEQPEQQLLDYLREVNALPSPLSGDALSLVQQAATIRLAEFFNWSVQDVHECIRHIAPGDEILKKLAQLDLLMRVRELAAHTGMDAVTIFLIGTLPEVIDPAAYKDAAEHALLSISESSPPAATVNEALTQLATLTIAANKNEVVPNKPGEKIIYTVTLKDGSGEALSGVFIHASATLGTIEDVATDPDGKAELIFMPGEVMGTEKPLFWLDLFEPQRGPTVNLVADQQTLQFPAPLKSAVPLAEVAYGQEVELYATMVDSYRNLGKHARVQWFAEPAERVEGPALVIRPRQGLTNEEGLTRVFVSSPTGGTFAISVLSADSENAAEFEPITFANPE